MKMKKLFATVLATALTVSTISTSVFATGWNADGGTETQTGEGSVIQPEIEVALPGDLSFEVDPLQLNTKAQILGGDYNIINYSNVDMAVTVKPTLVLASGLKAVSSNVVVDPTNSTTDGQYKTVSDNNAKAVAAAFIVADKKTAGVAMKNDVYPFAYSATSTLLGRTEFTYDDNGERINKDIKLITGSDDGKACKLLDTDEATATKYTFLLDKYAPTDTDVYIDEDGNIKQSHEGIITSFTIVGAVDPHKSYSDGDIQLKAVYGMNVVTKYEKLQSPYAGKASHSKQQFIEP